MEIYLNSDLKIRVSYISAINAKSFKQILDVYKC